jgi:alanyl-tRNA synthetase
MGTDSRAPAEPYTLSFEASVERGGRDVVLSETYFYPEGGGQPADRGTIGGVAVTDVQTHDGEVVHTLSEPVEADETVECRVDGTFRTYCMRAHTASHALYGAGRRLLDDVGYAGFGITAEADPGTSDGSANGSDAGVTGKVRVDFETSTEIDDEVLVELERLVNRTVWESRPVSWEAVPREEALSDEDVAFNTKTEEGVAGVDEVRVVGIGGWDRAACGGTHVENTREIGPVSVLERSNPGEGRTRVEFAVGRTAIDRRATERRASLAASRALGTAVESLPESVERLRAERDELESRIEALQGSLVESRLARLREETVEHGGVEWLVGTVEGLDSNALAERVRSLSGDAAGVVVLVSGDGSLAVGTAGEVDAGDVVDRVTGEFGGGGGGSPTVAQAGGLSVDPETVVRFLRENGA